MFSNRFRNKKVFNYYFFLYVGKGGGKKCGVKKKRKEKSRTGAIIMYCNQRHYIEVAQGAIFMDHLPA